MARLPRDRVTLCGKSVARRGRDARSLRWAAEPRPPRLISDHCKPWYPESGTGRLGRVIGSSSPARSPSLHPLGAPNVGSSFVHWTVGGRLRRRASVWSSSPGLALVRPLSGAHYLLLRCRLGVRNRLSHRSFVRIISGERRGCAHRGSRGVSYGHPAGIGGLRCRATLAQPAPESTRRAGI